MKEQPVRFGGPLPGGTLPVDQAIPELREALHAGSCAVLQAPAGAGKTTHVPIALLHERWLGGSKILMLEPRRIAARAVTHRMAHLLGERIGETVGYRVKRDTKVGPRTRIEVVTEGVLTRMVQNDPTLDGIGLVIFDEFHERSIHADAGLALTLYSQRILRPELRILVMSATLDGGRVAALLGGAPVITSEGRTYPVEISYSARPDARAIPAAVASTVMRALDEQDGDVLVFLPGGAEIRRTAIELEGRLPERVRVERLYGDLTQQSQDDAIAPAPPGWRKVVLSTPIAETSLTIEGVTSVVDSGLARAPQFSPRTGMTRLETVRISRSSANQRAGRAGRTRAGKCYRLWPELENAHLQEHAGAEILQADLAPLVLELAVAGVVDPHDLAWLDLPPAAAWAQATELLVQLGALSESGKATAHGRSLAALPAHPRIAHMLVASRDLGALPLACDIAALLAERDPVRGSNGPPDADIEIRLELLRASETDVRSAGAVVDAGLVRRIRVESSALRKELHATQGGSKDSVSAGVILALAYPDRIAQSRRGASEGRFLLRNGAGAILTHPQGLSAAEFIVAAELDGDARDSRVFLGAAISRAELQEHIADQITIEKVVEWDDRAKVVRALSRSRIGAIVLREASWPGADPEAIVALLGEVVRKEGIAALAWSDEARATRARMAFMHLLDETWPDVSDQSLDTRFDEWLHPVLRGRTSTRDLGDDLSSALLSLLNWRQRAELDRLAPVWYVAPTGTRVRIDYGDPVAPSISVRLQEMFGVSDTPDVGGGRVTLTVHLLSPARQPVQVTRDLGGFWAASYFEVRKQLRGRYPKHVWPDDPASASPTTRAKPRGQ
ncbi:MAG: ATP-dependent helicase HrpB [Gemmatimonadota bacterium]|nr:ATP-dependent helicase HrpB [Gemmatimonadota bacterium]